MTTYLGKSCSFGLPRVPFVNCRRFMYLVISLLVYRAGCGIWLHQFLIIAYLFTFNVRVDITLWQSQCSMKCRSRVPGCNACLKGVLWTITMRDLTQLSYLQRTDVNARVDVTLWQSRCSVKWRSRVPDYNACSKGVLWTITMQGLTQLSYLQRNRF